MKSLNVLVIAPAFDRSVLHAHDEDLRRISLAGPGINVRDASELAIAELRGDSTAKKKLDPWLAETEVIYGLILPRDLLIRAPRLKWVQTMSAGVDRFARMDIWDSPVTITGVSGIHATSIGEFTLQLMLMFAKRAPECFRMKQNHQWKRFAPSVLRGKTVGIVGLGNIGREVARLSKAFGMKVIATRRSATQAKRARYVDMLYPAGQLKQLLSESDYVVVSTPLTPETRGLIGEKELRSMKPGAYIINIARGGIIDEEALIRALDEKWIAGAGLDVVATEPLPPESRLWEFDNVILSPHIAGGMEDYMERATNIFCENIRRYLNGKKLLNIVDKKRGY
ncbi:MAG TPA: D-2-hydroxyacid dehydrogenase [Dehalococcoidales bacterium]|nr:D-2-hydroxyacid dehydrogenase [Dehalococcoidales bacterium]